MKYIFLFLLLSGVLLPTSTGQTAFLENYFNNKIPRVNGIIKATVKTPDYLIVLATIPHRREFPDDYVTVMNSNGILLWNSFNWPMDDPDYEFGEMAVDRDSLLYLSTVEGVNTYLIQVNYRTGEVNWKAPLPAGYKVNKIRKRGNTEIALSLSNQSINANNILFCSTLDGSIVYNFLTQQPHPAFMFMTDNTGFYYSYGDTIVKTDINNLSQIIWKTRIEKPGASKIIKITDFILNDNGLDMIIFAENEAGKVVSAKVSLNDGAMLSYESSSSLVSERLADWIIRGDTIFSCLESQGSGGSLFRYSVAATLRGSGQKLYQKFYFVENPATNTPFAGEHSSVNMATDNSGHLYLTGYFGQVDNYGWGVIKVNSWNGEKVWTKVIDKVPISNSGKLFNAGRIAWNTGNQKFWFGGEKNAYKSNPYPVLYEMDIADFTPKDTVFLSGNFGYGSAIVRMLPTEDGGYLTLKQLDNCAEVARYTIDDQASWVFPVCQYQKFRPVSLHKGFGGDYYLLGVSAYTYLHDYHFFREDSIHVFKLNAESGAVVNHWRVPLDLNLSCEPMFTCQTDTISVFFQESSYGNYVRIINNQVTSKQELTPGISLSDDLDDRFKLKERGRKTFICGAFNRFITVTPNSKQYISVPFSLFTLNPTSIELAPGSDHIIAGGQRQGTDDRWGLIRFKETILSPVVWQKSGLTGKITRVLAGDQNRLFTEGVIDNNIYVKHFSMTTGNLIWEKTINIPDGLPEIHDLVFDTVSKQLALGGNIVYPDNFRLLFLVRLDTNGNIITQLVKGGETEGAHNRVRDISLLPNSAVLVGGEMQRSGLGDAGFIWKLPAAYNNGSRGKVYVDLNDNAQMDAFEYPWRQTVSILPNNYFSFPDSSGNYLFTVLNDGQYQATVKVPSPYFAIKPANFTISAQNTVQDADIRLVPDTSILDAAIELQELTAPRFGFESSILISVKNVGTQTLDSVQIELDCGPHFTFQHLQAISDPSFIKKQILVGNTISADLSGLSPLQHNHLVAVGKLNTLLMLTDTLVCNSSLVAFPAIETYLKNNSDTLSMAIIGSYDPNDVTAYPGNAVPTGALNDDGSLDLIYRIRFENTGNAATDFVRINNQYSHLLRPETFFLGATSAPCNVRFLNDHQIEFLMENYALLPAALDSSRSQGYIFYSIKSQSGLVPGDSIFNSAEIYFDYNPPVFTNIANSYLPINTGVQEPAPEKNSFTLFPNPCTQGMYIHFLSIFPDNAPWILFDELGRQRKSGNVSAGIDTKGLDVGVYRVFCNGAVRSFVVVR